MKNKLCYINDLTGTSGSTAQIALFYPHVLGENKTPLLCVSEFPGYAEVLYCGKIFTVLKEYLSVWV